MGIVVLERTVRCSQTVRFFVMFYMFEVRFWAKMWCSELFEVRSCCYVTRPVLELTVWCSRTVRVFVMFDMFKVQFWAKMGCSESSTFRQSMFCILVLIPRLKMSVLLDFWQLVLNHYVSLLIKPSHTASPWMLWQFLDSWKLVENNITSFVFDDILYKCVSSPGNIIIEFFSIVIAQSLYLYKNISLA